MRKFLISAEEILTIICLLIYSGSPLDIFLTNGFTAKDADRIVFRLFFTFGYIFAFLLITLRWKKCIYLASKDKSIWILLGLCAVSNFWSLDSGTTLRRVFGLTGTMLFGVYLASRYTLKEQLKLLAYVIGISAVSCFLIVLLVPQYGLVQDAWRGIYTQKNLLGKRFVLGGAVFFFLAMTTLQNRWVLWLGYVTSAILVLFSKSTTSLGNFVIITAAFFLYSRVLRLKYKIMIPSLAFISTVGLIFYVWFVTQADAILGSVGKDTTLTGRAELWPVVLEMIAKKPWLGYGYGAFWEDRAESSIVVQAVQWNAPNAHNGFLDLWLALGLLGVLVFLVGLLINFLMGIYFIRSNEAHENSVWLLIFSTFTILSNLTETSLLEQNSIEWILYVSAVLSSKVPTRTNL